MATLLAGDMPEVNLQPSLIVTAGSPRFGNADYWNWFESRMTGKTDHYRLVHEKDPVPHVRLINFTSNLASLPQLGIRTC